MKLSEIYRADGTGAGHHRREIPFFLAPQTRVFVPTEARKGRARDAA
jgi:hypothetical protein